MDNTEPQMEQFNNRLINTINCSLKDLSISSTYEDIKNDLDILIKKIVIPNNTSNTNYKIQKLHFNKILNGNYKFLKDNFIFKDLEIFEDDKNWKTFLLIILSFLTIKKNINEDTEVNYNYMIKKILSKIEEYNDLLDNSDENINNSSVVDNLLGDIKDMLSNIDNNNIIDLSKKLSYKYQEKIKDGQLNINDLIGGVVGLLNNPTTINDKFKDFNVDNLNNLNSEELMNEISSNTEIKDAMNLFGGLKDSNGLGSILNLLGNNKADNNNMSSVELDSKIEELLNELTNKQ